jgi:sulfoxide reductase catalytic subunit YedY
MPRIPSSEITPKRVYLDRRAFISVSAGGVLGAAFTPPVDLSAQGPQGRLRKLEGVRKSPLSTSETPSSYEHVTGFNNFYEFASGAGDGPKRLSGRFRPSPWTLTIEGHVAKPASYASKTSSSRTCSKSASIVFAASKRGRWWFRGSASRWPT